MLSKKDKEWLAEMVEQKIREALTVKVKFEKRRNLDTGQPLAVPEVEVRDVYLPAHWVEFLPYYEASMRGVQETTDHVKNSVGLVANIILTLENSFTSIGKLSGEAMRRIEGGDKKLLDIT
jgi:hypothetical protein